MSEFLRSKRARGVLFAAIAVFGLMLPAFLEDFWVQLGAVVFATSIGAIGLMLLFGRVGQLSLGHPFFLAVGAYVYILLASPKDDSTLWGFGIHSVPAFIIAVAAAAFAGFLLSPLAARLKGLSLGLATLSLVFIGIWILYTLDGLSGGYNGRNAPPMVLGPLSSEGSNIAILGLEIGSTEFLWYLTLGLLVAVSIFTVNLLKGRVGRAFTAIRDAEVHASALGVEVGRYRAVAFTLSSAYAGMAGALLAVVMQRVVPEYWGIDLALSYLAMIVIGGLHSVTGAVVGALFVTALPALLGRYGEFIPGVGTEGGEGLGPSVIAQLVYGAAVIIILIFEPEGLVKLFSRLAPRSWRRTGDSPDPGVPEKSAAPGTSETSPAVTS